VKKAGKAGAVKVLGLGLPSENRAYVKEGVTQSVILWNVQDLGYLTIKTAVDATIGKLNPGATAYDAGKLGTIQPYFDFTHGNYDRVAEPVNIWDLGFNWLINGRRVKLTCNYQNRTIYFESLGTKPSKQSNKSMWVMQFQLAI